MGGRVKRDRSSPVLERRLRGLKQAIAENERRQRRLARALARGRPPPLCSKTGSIRQAPDLPVVSGSPSAVRFTHDNAPIFMSGNLEELRGRCMTPAESRNRRRVLLVFMAIILTGVLYRLLRGSA